MRAFAAAIVLVGLTTLAGCGSSGDDAAHAPTTPADFVRAMNRAAYLGRPDAMIELLDDEARNQKGKQWIALIQRVGHPQALAALGPMLDVKKTRDELETMDTAAFFQYLQAHAPIILQRLLAVYVTFDYEENGRVLVYATGEQGQPVWLAMQRDDNGGLRLMAEQQVPALYAALGKKLQTAYNEQRKAQSQP
jgi:hypothetical protein